MSESSPPLDLDGLLRFSQAQGVSDIHLKPGRPPIFRLSSSMELVTPRNLGILSESDVRDIFADVLEDRHRELLKENGSVDLGWGVPGIGRFRINLFRSRLGTQAVVRFVTSSIPTLEELFLPPVIKKICEARRGLILVTGAAGQGKSTTLAAIADQINRSRAGHIITIEDPIEYLIEDKRSVVTQREVGSDTVGFREGLRAALRQDPDVIVVGEMRDRETIETAIMAAETGHLVLSTLHTVDVRETVNRVLSVFRETEQDAARIRLAAVMQAVVSQRLVHRASGKGRVPAVEVMLCTGRLRDIMKEHDGADMLSDAIEASHDQYGMQTFDQSLMSLFREKMISYDEAVLNSSRPDDFALRVKGIDTRRTDAETFLTGGFEDYDDSFSTRG